MHPVLQADETPLQLLSSLKRVLCGLRQCGRLRGGNMFRRCQAGALMVDGDTGNAALVILHLLQSEEAITLTFLSRCFELIGQSLQWFAIHNLTFF